MATKKKPENTQTSRRTPKTDHLVATQWQPGQSGNPGGRPKKVITSMMESTLEKVAVKGDKEARTWLLLIVQGAFKQAAKGDVRALEVILDRIEGKVPQAHQVSGPGGGAIPITSLSPEENERRIAELLAKMGAQ